MRNTGPIKVTRLHPLFGAEVTGIDITRPLTQRELVTLADAALCLAASGKWTAAGDAAGRVWLWDNTPEKPPAKGLKDHATPVRALAISPDGQWIVSVAEDRSVRIWSVAEGTVVYRTESPVPRRHRHRGRLLFQ